MTTTTRTTADFMRLLHSPGDVFEIRVLGVQGNKKHTSSGMFNDVGKAATCATSLDTRQSPRGVYVTVNPLKPAILARAANRIQDRADSTAGDQHVERRRWLPIDVDPMRAGGVTDIAATDDEIRGAWDVAESTRAWLSQMGWPEPVEMSSGNGRYLLYPIDLPNDAASAKLLRLVLLALNQKQGTPEAQIDLTMFNASRIIRVAGTTNRKGDSLADRPHRVATLDHVPDYLAGGWSNPISLEPLEAVAQLAHEPATNGKPMNGNPVNGRQGASPAFSHRLIVDKWLDARGCQHGPAEATNDGRRKWRIDCPFNAEHGRDAAIMQSTEGALAFHCFHNSCAQNGWQQVRDAIGAPAPEHYDPPRKPIERRIDFDPREYGIDGDRPDHDANGGLQGGGANEAPGKTPIERFTIRELRQTYPTLYRPIIDGLLRQQETANLISVSKVGKSWLAYNLALSVATGRAWLDVFPTAQGRVLIVDNELHRPTLAHRIPAVADAMGIDMDQYGDSIEVWPVRGKGISILDLEPELRKAAGQFQVIILDAKYRFVVPGKSENDNAAETAFYNTIDGLAETSKAAFVMIHHSSKGSQTEKRVTDVGSGAGAQSRAADCHIVLREHEDPDCVVLDAAVRSFKPVQPMGLRWEFPLWVADDDIDPQQLKGRKTARDEKQTKLDAEADGKILACCQTWCSRPEIKKGGRAWGRSA